jgi:hypothetical protein
MNNTLAARLRPVAAKVAPIVTGIATERGDVRSAPH